MSVSQGVAGHLPYLRRFARALCGSRASGDAYVVAVLEALIADPGLLDGRPGSSTPVDLRVALYRAFLDIWNSLELNTAASNAPVPAEAAAVRRLEDITPRARQAFLLSSVEGFSPAQTAVILSTDGSGVAKLIDQAGREIAEQIATEVLIIEDEPLIAMDLASIVESLGHRVTGRARTHAEAIKAVRRNQPGLVLADIALADKSSGLDAVNEILSSIEVPVIFITAYPERLLTGERPEPAFLISKPFEPDAVKAIVSQALFFDQRASKRKSRVTAERDSA